MITYYSENTVSKDSNLKKSEAEINLFPRNFILVQAYSVAVDSYLIFVILFMCMTLNLHKVDQ